MTDQPASWRMPTPKQMEKLAAAAAVRGSVPPVRTPGPGDEMPAEYWQAVLDDRHADAGRRTTGPSIRTQRLYDIQRHLLRVACRRCGRTVEIQRADAVRLAGPQAVWKDVGQRLLDDRTPRGGLKSADYDGFSIGIVDDDDTPNAGHGVAALCHPNPIGPSEDRRSASNVQNCPTLNSRRPCL
jgi:hypothetical protein